MYRYVSGGSVMYMRGVERSMSVWMYERVLS